MLTDFHILAMFGFGSEKQAVIFSLYNTEQNDCI